MLLSVVPKFHNRSDVTLSYSPPSKQNVSHEKIKRGFARKELCRRGARRAPVGLYQAGLFNATKQAHPRQPRRRRILRLIFGSGATILTAEAAARGNLGRVGVGRRGTGRCGRRGERWMAAEGGGASGGEKMVRVRLGLVRFLFNACITTFCAAAARKFWPRRGGQAEN